MNNWSFGLFWWAGTREGEENGVGNGTGVGKKNRQKERNPDPEKAYPINYRWARRDKMPPRQKPPQEIY